MTASSAVPPPATRGTAPLRRARTWPGHRRVRVRAAADRARGLAVIQVGLVVRDQMGVVHAAREAVRAASVDRDPGAAARAAHRSLPGATVDVGARPSLGGEITVTVRVPLGHEPAARRRAVPGSRPARVGDHAGRAVNAPGRRAERGGVTILMVAVVVLGLALSLGAARLGSAIIGRARADTAADASALAAADALALGGGADAASGGGARDSGEQ